MAKRGAPLVTTEDTIHAALKDPVAALAQLDRIESQAKLVDFIRLTWSILEPGREFVDGWAVRAVCDHLEAVSRGEIRKLLINVPPGCMKSMTTSVFWPAWEWGPRRRPDLRYVCASYSEALTVRDNRRCRALILSDVYRRHWGSVFGLAGDQSAKVRFDTDKTGFKIATSVSGLGTGERGDRFIIDDPHNVKESESDVKREGVIQWFTEVVPTRINDAGKSAIIVIMQRVHEGDVSGLILAKELGYEHLCLPMEFEPGRRCRTSIFMDPRTEEGELLWPERFSREYIETDLKPHLRAWGGSYAESGQLQQRPSPRGGGMFQRKDFQFLDVRPTGGRRVRGWDLAATAEKTAAWSAGVLMNLDPTGRVVIEDIVRVQGTPGQVETLIEDTAEADGPGVEQDLPQDPGQSGKAQKMHLVRLLAGHVVHFSPETGSKEDRARPLASQAEGGNLYLVRGKWNDAFVNEATKFPRGTFKDQIDASSRAYAALVMRRRRRVGCAPKQVKAE